MIEEIQPIQQAGYTEAIDTVLTEIGSALRAVDPGQIDRMVDALLGAEKVFFTGVGRVLLSLQAMVKRLNHLGIPSWCVGDLNEPAITERDVLLVGSGSGQSVIPVAIAMKAREYRAKIIHIGANENSPLKPLTDIFVRIPVRSRVTPPSSPTVDLSSGMRPEIVESKQIMTSLFEQSLYILGDVVALTIMERKKITSLESLWNLHANLE